MMISSIGGYVTRTAILPVKSFGHRRARKKTNKAENDKTYEILQRLKASLELAELELLHWKMTPAYRMDIVSSVQEEINVCNETIRKAKAAENRVKELRAAISKYEGIVSENTSDIDERW